MNPLLISTLAKTMIAAVKYASDVFDRPVAITSIKEINKWLYEEFVPFARCKVTDPGVLRMIVADGDHWYAYEKEVLDDNGCRVKTLCDFANNVMRGFKRSYLDGWHYVECEDEWGDTFTKKVDNYEIFECRMTKEKACEWLVTFGSRLGGKEFFLNAIVPELPSFIALFKEVDVPRSWKS